MGHHRFDDPATLTAAVTCWLDTAVAEVPGRYVALAVGDSTLPAFGGLGPLPPGKTVICLDELVPPPADPARRFSARLAAALPPTWAGALRPFDTAFGGPAPIEAAIAGDGLAVALCGLGPDGHVAFNQPPDDGSSRTRLVTLTGANRARLGDVTPATGALTLGLATIRSASRLAVVVAGPGKATALRRLLDGPTGDDFPVSALRDHPSLSVFSNASAAELTQ